MRDANRHCARVAARSIRNQNRKHRSMNRELISEAVARRLDDVRERVRSLKPQQFGEMSEFVLSVQDASIDQSRVAQTAVPEHWIDNDGECLDSLRTLSLGRP